MQRDTEPIQDTPSPRRYRGPQGLGEAVARALGERADTGEGLGGVEEDAFLRRWLAENSAILPLHQWEALKPITAHTSEHEVKFREGDRRAVKRTWPGTFGNIPRQVGDQWVPTPATPAEYLHRWALQNELFGDDVRLEGGMIAKGPSMVLGMPPDGLSLVISQAWLDAADPHNPHPTEFEIAAILKDRGFEPLFRSLYGWRHHDAGIIVLDAKPDNFVKTASGILPIDLLLAQMDSFE